MSVDGKTQTAGFQSEALKGASAEAERESADFIEAVAQKRDAEDWATAWARHLVAKWEHGDETHRQWLRDRAIPDLAWALRHANHGRTTP